MSEFIGQSPKDAAFVDRLRNEWGFIVKHFTGGRISLVDYEANRLAREYQRGDGRSYHNLSHIRKVNEVLDEYRGLTRNYVALKFAADGHDVIYVPGSETNEADSAAYMKVSMTRLGLPERLVISETERIILLTKDHKTTDDDVDGKLMIDADFAIFAAPEEEYDAYAQGIWQEFVGSGKVPEEAFKRGRSNLLVGWLSQERIFITDAIRNDMEPQARINLERERQRLAA